MKKSNYKSKCLECGHEGYPDCRIDRQPSEFWGQTVYETLEYDHRCEQCGSDDLKELE